MHDRSPLCPPLFSLFASVNLCVARVVGDVEMELGVFDNYDNMTSSTLFVLRVLRASSPKRLPAPTQASHAPLLLGPFLRPGPVTLALALIPAFGS